MSSVVNIDGYKSGSIYRIALKNFVTYKEVELYPGPSLNLIIGPNGTGKSTFVCAIILGLCGKTSVIGRAKKISEYVRSGCQEATIELELYRGQGEHNIIITRIFNLKEVTMWKIDNKTVKEKAVQEVIASMDIQVDNLCQLLPQDRVQDFSKMNPQELLRSTLAALGGHQSVEQLDELIKCREEQRGLSSKLLNNAQLLEQKKRQNEKIKAVIDTMKQRKEIEEQIAMCERKKVWIEYQEELEKRTEYQQDVEKATKLLDTHQHSIVPLQKQLSVAQAGISKIEQRKLNIFKDVRTVRDKIKDSINLVLQQQHKIKAVDDELNDKIKTHENKKSALIFDKAKLDKLMSDQAKLSQISRADGDVKEKIAELSRSMAKINATIEQTNAERQLKWQNELENKITPHIRSVNNKIRQMENVYEKRLEVLERYSSDTYNAVGWLRENRELFQHSVYEPMLLEINFTDIKYARYLESTVASRDLVAFTFESNEDMNLFLDKVRKEQGWKRVNAICSQSGKYKYKKQDIEELRYLGFQSYIVDTITAPDPIIRFLCTQYGIHTIPIGNDHTYENSKLVPPHIRLFFSENHRFSIRISSYSGDKAISTSEVRPARLLANTLDFEKLEEYKTELEELEKKAQFSREKIQELIVRAASLQKDLNEVTIERKRITDRIEKLTNIATQILMQSKRVQDTEKSLDFNEQEERAKSRRIQGDIVLEQCKLHQKVTSDMKAMLNKELNGQMWKAKLGIFRQAIIQQESHLRELKERLLNARQTLENAQRLLSTIEAKARLKLTEARRACNSKLLPHHANFPYKEQFEKLPSELSSLQEHCYELQARIDCMDKDGDERTIREYNEREREITALQKQVNNSSDVNKQLEKKMKKISAKWLPPLESLLRDINASFGEMFEKLGCAGEIKLERAGDEDDYDKYGIAILVRFRASEELQQLTRHAQSGGERAVSTALYLMALQRLTKVPFRCVDEINQGMDPINERKMFQLLVKVTTECDNAQYFLLTPKLLANLEYNSKVMVHTIMNGRYVLNYREWSYGDFLKRAHSVSAGTKRKLES